MFVFILLLLFFPILFFFRTSSCIITFGRKMFSVLNLHMSEMLLIMNTVIKYLEKPNAQEVWLSVLEQVFNQVLSSQCGADYITHTHTHTITVWYGMGSYNRVEKTLLLLCPYILLKLCKMVSLFSRLCFY